MRVLISRLKSRLKFGVWYPWALLNSRVTARLRRTTVQRFDHPWVSGVKVFRAHRHGYHERAYIAIDAPVVVVVLHEDKPALVMSCSVVGRTLTIRQLQGVSGIHVPRDLAWPARFVAACQDTVRRENLRMVRLTRAEALPTFRNPTIFDESQDAARARLRIRQSMVRRYDETAELLDFVFQNNRYATWRNPQFSWQSGKGLGRLFWRRSVG
jgi:hypothetical protein